MAALLVASSLMKSSSGSSKKTGSGFSTGMNIAGSAALMAFMVAPDPFTKTLTGLAALTFFMLGMMGSGKKKTETVTETQSQTTSQQVSSRIDATNKNLQIINRNLIGLRSDIKTYILPASAYFGEKRNQEDQYSIMSRRGFSGN